MTAPFLDYEIALLLAKYGKKTVLTALSRGLELSDRELTAELDSLKARKPKSKSEIAGSEIEPIERVVRANPTKTRQLRELAAFFQRRTFLPELRDVKRFFEENNRPFGSTRSRSDALPKLLELLAHLDAVELDELCQSHSDGEYSHLGSISDQILRGQ